MSLEQAIKNLKNYIERNEKMNNILMIDKLDDKDVLESYFKIDEKIKELTKIKDELKNELFSKYKDMKIVDTNKQQYIDIKVVERTTKKWNDEKLIELLQDKVDDYKITSTSETKLISTKKM